MTADEGRRSVRFAQLVEAGRPNSRSSVWIVDCGYGCGHGYGYGLDLERHGYRPSFSGSLLYIFFNVNTVWCELRVKKFMFAKESSAIY